VKIISGGQVGVDIAALRAAKAVGFETGGWMPKGFKTLNGNKPGYAEQFGMVETADEAYPRRTYMNVFDSDGTLRIAANWKSRGEICTLNAIKSYEKPYYDLPFETVQLFSSGIVRCTAIVNWMIDNNITTLNVAGNAVRSMELPVETFLISMFRENWNRLPVDSV
jgi:hypothetical protein